MELKQLKKIVEGSQFFSVKFRKHNSNEIRVMNCSSSFKHLEIKGTGQPVLNRLLVKDNRVYQQNLRTGIDVTKATAKSIRSFYAEDIIYVKAHGKKYNADGEEVA